ncbi:MAG: hypothetical protein HY812_07410 [Planctomycetes bacterium]|nr:hypothetical protein [Planctomycetota bacterium]
MNTSLLRRGLAVTVLVAAFAAPLHAGYESAVPGDVLAFAGVDDVGELKQSFQETPWGRFLQDPALESLRSCFQRKIDELAAKAEAKSGANPFLLAEMLSGPAAFVVVDAFDPQLTDAAAERFPMSLALLLGVGERGEEFLDLVNRLAAEGVATGNAVRQSEQVGDVEVAVLLPAGEETGDFPVAMRYGLCGSTFVVTFEAGEYAERSCFAALLDGLAGDLEAPLAENEEFTASVAALQGSGYHLFVDAGRIINRALDLMLEGDEETGSAEKKEAAFTALGLRDFGRIAAFTRMGAEGTFGDMELTWRGDGHIWKVLHALCGSGEMNTAALVPQDVASYQGFHVNVTAALDAFMELMDEVSPEEAQQVRAMMDASFQQEGWNVRTDLLANLAGEIGVFTASVDEAEALAGTEDDPQSFAFLVRLVDGARVETVIDGLLKEQGMLAVRKREEFEGRAVYELPMPLGGGNLHYTILQDLLVGAMSAELVRDVLRRCGADDLPVLRDNEDFGASLPLLGGADVTLAYYNDTGRSAQKVLSMLKALAEDGTIQGVPFPIDPELRSWIDFEMPDPALAKKYFKGGDVGTVRVEENRLLFSSISP